MKNDIYTFSKALGGGISKIGATCIAQDKYCDELGKYIPSFIFRYTNCNNNFEYDSATRKQIKQATDKFTIQE